MADEWLGWLAGGLLALLAGAFVFGGELRSAIMGLDPGQAMSPSDPTTDAQTVSGSTATTSSSPTTSQNPYEDDGVTVTQREDEVVRDYTAFQGETLDAASLGLSGTEGVVDYYATTSTGL